MNLRQPKNSEAEKGTAMNFVYQEDFPLETGGLLPGFNLHYTTYGTLNNARDNVVWVCHALTGSADVLSWWKGLFGPGKLYDPERYFIVCANTLGGCYGSTGPLSVDPRTGAPYYHQFPSLTNKDIVSAFDLLRQHLNLEKVHTLIGGSLGGQHALEWAVQQPAVFSNLIPIATNARHSPWGIAFNETQRMAISADGSWSQSTAEAGINGMKTARAIALLSYRHATTYAKTQKDPEDAVDHFNASSYQVYQGEKLATRFNAYTYWILSKAMDSHNVGRGRGSITKALHSIQANTLSIGVDSDLLFPIQEQEFLARNIPESTFIAIQSDYGHDGFLVENKALTSSIKSFYKKSSLKIAQV